MKSTKQTCVTHQLHGPGKGKPKATIMKYQCWNKVKIWQAVNCHTHPSKTRQCYAHLCLRSISTRSVSRCQHSIMPENYFYYEGQLVFPVSISDTYYYGGGQSAFHVSMSETYFYCGGQSVSTLFSTRSIFTSWCPPYLCLIYISLFWHTN